jgi:hypothetical protein
MGLYAADIGRAYNVPSSLEDENREPVWIGQDSRGRPCAGTASDRLPGSAVRACCPKRPTRVRQGRESAFHCDGAVLYRT